MDSSCDVLIVGASFAGIEVYRQLRRSRSGRKLSIVLVDRQAEHGYIPLAHERLTSRLPLEKSELPTERCVTPDPHARFLVDEVTRVDVAARTVSLRSGSTWQARFVVVALGSELSPPPSMPGAEHLLRYKFAREFVGTRARLAQVRERGTSMVVVGGGISGVELAGDLALWSRETARANAPNVTLVETADRLLVGLDEHVGRHARRALERQGVTVRLNTTVQQVHPDSLHVQTEHGAREELTNTIGIWAAGVRPNSLLSSLALPRTTRGFLAVGPTLQASAGVFACGDAVRVVVGEYEWPTMQRAIECLWQAKVVGHNILALANESAPRPLRHHTLRRDFPYGVSMGTASTIVYGRMRIELGRIGIWFRRFLMRRYIARYMHLKMAARAGAPEPGGR